MILHVRWQGGAVEDIHCELPLRISDRIRYKEDFLKKIKGLAKSSTDDQIAEILNQEGLMSAKGKTFTPSMVTWVRYKHGIPSPHLKRSNELTVKEIADKFGVSRNVVYYWIERGFLQARKIRKGYPFWITLDPMKEKELRERIKNSYKLNQKAAGYS